MQGARYLYIGPRTLHLVCTENKSNWLLGKYLVVRTYFCNFEPKNKRSFRPDRGSLEGQQMVWTRYIYGTGQIATYLTDWTLKTYEIKFGSLRNLLIRFLQDWCEHWEEFGSEHLAERLNGKEKLLCAFATFEVMPDTLLVHPSSCDDAVNVRMVIQIGSPCVENACHASLQSLSVKELLQSAPCCLEHAGVELFHVW